LKYFFVIEAPKIVPGKFCACGVGPRGGLFLVQKARHVPQIVIRSLRYHHKLQANSFWCGAGVRKKIAMLAGKLTDVSDKAAAQPSLPCKMWRSRSFDSRHLLAIGWSKQGHIEVPWMMISMPCIARWV
jgi:hypothetical protein